jgi:hypothetical protein
MVTTVGGNRPAPTIVRREGQTLVGPGLACAVYEIVPPRTSQGGQTSVSQPGSRGPITWAGSHSAVELRKAQMYSKAQLKQQVCACVRYPRIRPQAQKSSIGGAGPHRARLGFVGAGSEDYQIGRPRDRRPTSARTIVRRRRACFDRACAWAAGRTRALSLRGTETWIRAASNLQSSIVVDNSLCSK